jgi:hypothetical protein
LEGVKGVGLGVSVLALASVLAGCTINDSTENEFAPQIINNTRSTATIVYCSGTSSCGSPGWTETLRPGRATASNVNAGRGSLAVFSVTQDGTRRCIRLGRYAKTIRLSDASRAACHPPYGRDGSFGFG